MTWLTPYVDLWEAHVGAIACGRLAKALTPARKLLGEEACILAFASYCKSHELRKSPEWFTKDCRRWDAIAAAPAPLVSAHGTLTAHGKRVYEGRA